MFKKYSEIIQRFRSVGRSAENMMKLYDEPTYLGFKLLFHFNDPESPLLNLQSDYSAYKYLTERGYNTRASLLKNFVTKLQQTSRESEWYFQSASGLESIIGFDFYEKKVNSTGEIDVTTLEGLDMRVTNMFDNYYRACFDTNTRKEIVPKNLRYFKMSVYICDIREFYDVHIASNNQATEMEVVPDGVNKSSLLYELNLCEFDKYSRKGIFSSVDNTEVKMASTSFKIHHWGAVNEYPNYVLDTQLNLEEKNPDVFADLEKTKTPTLKEKIQKQLHLDKNSLNTLKEDVSNINSQIRSQLEEFGTKSVLNGIYSAEQFARGKINNVILGNIYDDGLTIRNVRDVLNSGISII